MTNKKRNRKNKKKDASSSSSSSSSATAAISTTATARANGRIMDREGEPLDLYSDKAFPYSLFLGRGQTSTAFDVFVLMTGAHKTNLHLSLPWALEGALRGHCGCIRLLNNDIYNFTYQVTSLHNSPIALRAYWAKTHDSLLNERDLKKNIKAMRVYLADRCCTCFKVDLEEGITVRKCDNCTIRGDKQIPALERLRNRLGLTRKKEEYQHLLVPMKDLPRKAINGSPNRPHAYCIARNDGTVHIGSTPAVI
ncbi:hypothetical protein FRACYDRAFT_251691 [Fragilariopsis cylindrus CCMP1102]|uniref:Uncharacterized protein n=1 Tax=Fragilariopsis cylindrus CCMP1102 TaxID=635003 RepID=A0A1E7EMJ5_9STRA|nr:hypothetical protein FRACYDRAFT_251691 [Fragilariopsis cylindrus CCMP1102]|eukprot:OEU07158.1 hypothetical protein FRACYDRAFT_251691 [Fragilariopsis cylindrus CCMP1102]